MSGSSLRPLALNIADPLAAFLRALRKIQPGQLVAKGLPLDEIGLV